MGKRVSEMEKAYIMRRRGEGASLQSIAAEIGYGYETVRKWWRIQRDHRVLRAVGRPRNGSGQRYDATLRAAAIALKVAHPSWGARAVRTQLQARFGEAVPSASWLGSLFRRDCPQAVRAYTRRYYRASPPPNAYQAHDCWQLDGKEKVTTQDGTQHTCLTLREVASGLILGTQAFDTTTTKAWRKVRLAEVQTLLRATFVRYGRPKRLQTDHEDVYVGHANHDLPAAFTLWLAGLGIEHTPSRVQRPTDQAQVERTHRTLYTWVCQDRAPRDTQELQAQLSRWIETYNTTFAARASDCASQPPLTAHPEATYSGRPFDPAREALDFQWPQVYRLLLPVCAKRLVSASGNVSIARRLYPVGQAFARQTLFLSFDPTLHLLRLQDAAATLVTSFPLTVLLPEALLTSASTLVDLPTCQLPLPLRL